MYGIPSPLSSSRIHSAALSKKYLSCVIATTVPGNSWRKCSSHATLSASKWLVGSSSSNMSGLDNSRRHNATRRFSPPDSWPTMASHSGSRSASAAISNFRSKSQPPPTSISCCNSPCSVSNAFISSSLIGSAKRMLIASNLANLSFISATASSTTSRTVLVKSISGSCAKYPILIPACGRASPS